MGISLHSIVDYPLHDLFQRADVGMGDNEPGPIDLTVHERHNHIVLVAIDRADHLILCTRASIVKRVDRRIP